MFSFPKRVFLGFSRTGVLSGMMSSMLFGMVAVVSAESQPAEERTPVCSEQTLKGTYLYYIQGRDAGMGDYSGWYREAGMESFDGGGRVRNIFTDTLGNSQLAEGRYGINPDCTGEAYYEDAEGHVNRYHLFVDPRGKRFHFVEVGSTNAKSGQDKRVTRDLILFNEPDPSRCSNASLQGTYIYSLNGSDPSLSWTEGYFAEAGIEYFDGVGNHNIDYSGSGENGASQRLSGEYQIDGDCSGFVNYRFEDGSELVYRVYVAPAGEGFVFIDLLGQFRNVGQNERVSRANLLAPNENAGDQNAGNQNAGK
jgi:hypothetical protein